MIISTFSRIEKERAPKGRATIVEGATSPSPQGRDGEGLIAVGF